MPTEKKDVVSLPTKKKDAVNLPTEKKDAVSLPKGVVSSSNQTSRKGKCVIS